MKLSYILFNGNVFFCLSLLGTELEIWQEWVTDNTVNVTVGHETNEFASYVNF